MPAYVSPSSPHSAQWVVARRPSSKPAAARTNAPEQTDVTRRASVASRPTWASSSWSAAAASMSAPPATIKVSTGPVTSAMGGGGELESAAGAAPGHRVVVTTLGAVADCGQEARGAGEHLERAGDVEDLGRIERHDDDVPLHRRIEGRLMPAARPVSWSSRVHGSTVRRGARWPTSSTTCPCGWPGHGHTLKTCWSPTCSTPASPPSTWSARSRSWRPHPACPACSWAMTPARSATTRVGAG